jgi:DNA ligase-1
LERKKVKDSAYLFLGSIGPAFESTTLGVGDKLALKAIAVAYGVFEEEVKKIFKDTRPWGCGV